MLSDDHHSIVTSSLNLETEHQELMEKHLIPSDYFHVFYILHTFAEKWKRIGSFLKLPATALDKIMEEHGKNLTKALSEVVSLWLARSYNTKEFGEPSLGMLVKAVADSAGNASVESVAKDIFKEHFAKDELPTGNIKGHSGTLVLHQACVGGNVSLIKSLILEHNVNVIARDDHNNTPLHLAALSGNEEVVLALINQFGCDVNINGYKGRSVIHYACAGGNVSLVKSLVHKHKANVSARDDDNNTPLHVAALKGKEEVALALINLVGHDVKGYNGKSVLHQAAAGGNDDLVKNLVLKYKIDINARDDDNNTPLHVAALNRKKAAVLALINLKFRRNVNISKGYNDTSVLHQACAGGNFSLVENLVHKHRANVNAMDDDNNRPLHLAALSGKKKITLFLVKQCGINVRGYEDSSVLHYACAGGNVSLVQSLIHEYKADVTAKVADKYTPLHVAALNGKEEVVLFLINKFGYDVNEKGHKGRSVLHSACTGDNVSLVRSLILKHKANVSARDDDYDTPLHLAALSGKEEIALILINQFNCDADVKGYLARTPLHWACYNGRNNVVTAISKYASLLAVDDDGNTPLHVCSARGYIECVEALLALNAPVLVRNKQGKTPKEETESSEVMLTLQNKTEKILDDHSAMQEHAKKRYLKPEHITRVIVIGDSESGKNCFMHFLKKESLKPFFRVSEYSGPTQISGILPSVHNSKCYGRVLFYNFSGDPKYYSSHGTILSSLRKGSNIFVIVADMKKEDDTIRNLLHYYFSFIEKQKFVEEFALILIGSHADLKGGVLKDKSEIFENFRQYVQTRVSYRCELYMLNCRYPSQGVGEVQQFLKTFTSDSPLHSLSVEASMLLGLLERDFSNITACSLSTLLSHVEETGLALPKSPRSLYSVLHELHELGLLLVIGNCNEGDVQVILNISQLTDDIHQLLFGQKFCGFPFNTGIVPESVLLEALLGSSITKKCLVQLQYCQEISHSDIGVPSSSRTPNESFLFFPALCSVDKSKAPWEQLFPHTSYSIGWLAQCSDPHDHFPPRFIHVLQLRLIFKYGLKAPPSLSDSSFFRRRCTLWKTGVQWPMEEGVLCTVELVKDSKEVVVITKSGQDNKENCVSVFDQIVGCVMEAKAEFCHSIRPKFFLLVSTEEDYLAKDNLIEVEEVLTSLEKKVELVFSTTGKRSMECSKLHYMWRLNHWNQLFPIDFNSVSHLLRSTSITKLCTVLDVPNCILEEAENAHPCNVSRRRRHVLWWWWIYSIPCWYNLVKALKDIGENYSILDAKEVEKNKSAHIEMQKKLLDKDNHSLTPDVKFLELFCEVIGSKWPSLASLLSLTGGEIEGVLQEGEGLSHHHCAYLMLEKWISKEGSTYGELYQKLRTTSLFQFQYCHR